MLHLPPELIPDEIRAIAGIIGTEATLRLIEKFGGLTIRFVRGARTETRDTRAELDELLGADNMSKLISHFGEATVYIAQCKAALLEIRDRAIRAAYDAGEAKIADLVYEHRLSDRRIKQILKQTDVDDAPSPQPSLF